MKTICIISSIRGMHSDCYITLKSVRLIKPMNKICISIVNRHRLQCSSKDKTKLYYSGKCVCIYKIYTYSLNATTDLIAINA